jgi:hypothetical protein
MGPLSDKMYLQTFLVYSLTFHKLNGVFWKADIINFYEIQFADFSVMVSTLVFCLRNVSFPQAHEYILLCFVLGAL